MFTQKWLLAKDALNGSGGFDDGSFLTKYPRESDEKFKSRKQSAYYVNLMKRHTQRFVDYLSKQPPQRSTNNSVLKSFEDNCDMRGNHMNQFIQDFTLNARARGCCLVLVDMPKNIEGNQDEQIRDRNIPYLSAIQPENVTDYMVDKYGAFEYVEFSGMYPVGDKIEQVKYFYDKNFWSIKKGDEVLESGEHGLTICPVLAFTENGTFPTLGAYYQIADLSKTLYNKQSELDEILRGQTFSILTYHIPQDANDDIADQIGATIGTNNMLLYQGLKPEFISPSSAPAETYRDVISDIKEEIDNVANNVDLGAQQQSGTALALRFQNMNSQLLNYARRLEDFEQRIFDVVGLWLNMNIDIQITYPSDFNMLDKSLEIEVLQNMQSLGAPHTYFKEKMKQIISADLIGLNSDTEAALMGELDEVKHERSE